MDLNLSWTQESNNCAEFEPELRFPTAVHWEVRGTKVTIRDKQNKRVGFRTTIEGRFKSHMSLETFPHDVQALKITVRL